MKVRFYVYELREETGKPFYVGKGSGRRMWEHKYRAKNGEKSHRANKIRKILAEGGKVVQAVVFTTEDEHEALSEEVRLIALYGRDNLTNQTDGGDGTRGLSAEARSKIAASRRGKKASEETRERQRAAKLGVPRTAETKVKISKYNAGRKKPWAKPPQLRDINFDPATFRGRKHTPETIAKMRAAKLGHEVSEETRRKISESKKAKGRKS